MLTLKIIATIERLKPHWRYIGMAISVLLIGAGSLVLFNLLWTIDIDKVLSAMQSMPINSVLMAVGFVILGYLTLTFYDFFSLRTIGRYEVPYWGAALAGFTSYAIGHNLGATVFTAGAVRYKIYSTWNLTVVDIAKIAFVTGLTFWLGNAFVLGLCMAVAPEAASAINQLPPWINRAIALVGLAAITGYLVWLLMAPRAIGSRNWRIQLPNASLTLIQIGIGVLDLGFGALVIYTLLPAYPSVDLLTVVVTFVIATVLGFLSHAPGGLGIFDAAVLIALHQFETELLLASLLMFRILYYLLPFALGILILCARELICWKQRKKSARLSI